ncbi:MAG: hypothetical protein ACI9TH_004067 [Kiritimatiellia bacterium]|jgi:hypothetical protein
MRSLKYVLPVVCMIALNANVFAKDQIEEYKPNVTLGDGKDGRVWKQWIQATKEAPVSEVRAKLRKVKGGPDCYLNLRFGKDGTTLDNSKRITLADEKVVTVSWNVGNVSPNGKPLIINAYKGEVLVEYITVRRR